MDRLPPSPTTNNDILIEANTDAVDPAEYDAETEKVDKASPHPNPQLDLKVELRRRLEN